MWLQQCTHDHLPPTTAYSFRKNCPLLTEIQKFPAVSPFTFASKTDHHDMTLNVKIRKSISNPLLPKVSSKSHWQAIPLLYSRDVQVIFVLPSQDWVLHCVVSVASPSQSNPFVSGAGLLHALERVLVPPAQVTEQSIHTDQGLHPPLTEERKSEFTVFLSVVYGAVYNMNEWAWLA